MGRKQFQTLTATVPSEQSYMQNVTNTTAVASGTGEQVTMYSPVGTIVRIVMFRFYMPKPTGGTAGDHQSYVVSNPSGFGIVYGDSKFSDNVEYADGEWYSATNEARPSVNNGQAYYSGHLVMDSTNGITFTYSNNVTGGTSNSRQYGIVGTEVDLP